MSVQVMTEHYKKLTRASGSTSGDVGGTSTSDAYTDNHTTTNSGTDIVEDTTHGNIGVTKSSELIASEL